MSTYKLARTIDIGVILPRDFERVDGGARKRGINKTGLPAKPLITVVTAVLNGERYLEQTIQSVMQQTYENVEYIVIDGGSTDGTLDIIKKYDHSIDYWISEIDAGIYSGMNKGVALATGEWISFINADDFLWSERVLERVATSLARLPYEVRIAYGQIMLLTSSGENLHVIGKPWDKVKRRFKYEMAIPHPAVMHRYSLFQKNGLFNESFRSAGDYEMLLRELIKGEAAFIQNTIVAGMRQGGISSRPEQAMNSLREVRRAQRLNGLTLPGSIWLMAVFRFYIRLLLWRVLGERLARKLLDLGRRIMGLPPVWVADGGFAPQPATPSLQKVDLKDLL
jgi:glycosyltransferase involved in cell wall biosynthesis